MIENAGPTYRLGAVAHAAGIPRATLASWLHRDQIELMKSRGDRDTTGTGDHRQFSWFRTINIALVAELSRLGIPPSAGTSKLALHFSDVGEATSAWRGEEGPPDHLTRHAGDIYKFGTTWFIVRNFDGKLEADVANTLDSNVLVRGSKSASSAVIVDMTDLVARVRSRLQQQDD